MTERSEKFDWIETALAEPPTMSHALNEKMLYAMMCEYMRTGAEAIKELKSALQRIADEVSVVGSDKTLPSNLIHALDHADRVLAKFAGKQNG